MEDFKFADFKNYVLSSIDQNLKNEGFKLSRSKAAFRKKINHNILDVAFDFLNYYPSYEYQFCIIIWIREIGEVVKKFYEFASINEPVKWNMVLFEGDFIDEVKEAEAKFRKSYYNEVRSKNEASERLSKTMEIINNQALPFAYSICRLESFQDFCIQNKQKVARNFDSNDFFISSLLAANLKSKVDYLAMAEYLKTELDIKKKQGVDYKQLYFYLDKIDDFVCKG